MQQTIALSQQKMKQGCGGPFGALIVKNGQKIAEGFNAVTSLNDPTAHAEIQAIRQACNVLGSFQLSGCEIYTSCEPCPMCLGALYWARIDRIYYACERADAARSGFDDSFIYEELSMNLSDRKIPMVQLLRDEGLKVFQEWDSKSDKVRY